MASCALNPIKTDREDGRFMHTDVFLKHHIIGGGYRENSICPLCRNIDRNRWVLYVLREFTNIFIAPCAVLHFAPEGGIRERIRVYR